MLKHNLLDIKRLAFHRQLASPNHNVRSVMLKHNLLDIKRLAFYRQLDHRGHLVTIVLV